MEISIWDHARYVKDRSNPFPEMAAMLRRFAGAGISRTDIYLPEVGNLDAYCAAAAEAGLAVEARLHPEFAMEAPPMWSIRRMLLSPVRPEIRPAACSTRRSIHCFANLVREKIVDTVPLTRDVCEKYLSKIYSSGVLDWKEDYRGSSQDPNGRSWGVEIRFDNGEEVYKGGLDQYPDSWRKFIKAVNALKLPDIK